MRASVLIRFALPLDGGAIDVPAVRGDSDANCRSRATAGPMLRRFAPLAGEARLAEKVRQHCRPVRHLAHLPRGTPTHTDECLKAEETGAEARPDVSKQPGPSPGGRGVSAREPFRHARVVATWVSAT